MADVGLQVDAEISPQSLKALQDAVTKAITQGVEKATKSSNAAAAQLKQIADRYIAVGKAAKEADLSASSVTSTIVASSKASIAALTRERVAFQQTKQLEIRETIAASKANNIEAQRAAQLQLITTRQTGQQRIQLTRAVLETIGRLEKGAGVVIEGVAKTTISAVGKGLSAIGSLFHRSDTDMTEGVGTALSKREQLIRESFSSQESVIRQSVDRQSRDLEQLTRTSRVLDSIGAQTRTGVIGAGSKLGLGIFGGFLAAGGLLTAVRSTFTVGSQYVRGLAVLQQQLGLTAEQMKTVDSLSVQLGNDVTLPGVSALDAANAIQILTKQFGSLGPAAVDAAEKAAKGTLQLSRATNSSAEDAAAVIGSAVNVFGISADKAVQVADEVAGALTKAAGVSFADFSDAFRQGASVFSSFVVPAEGATGALQDFNTALAVLAKSGLTGAGAGAAIKQFFQQGNSPTKPKEAVVAELTKRAGAKGSLFFDQKGDARDFSDSLDILRKGLVGLTDAQRNHDLQVLFGSRGIQAANALLKVSSQEYQDLKDGIDREGLAAKIAAAQNTGLKGALDATGSIIETVQILLYEKLQPTLGKVLLGFANFTNTLLFSSGAWHEVRIALLGIAGGIGALIAVKGAVEVVTLLGKSLALLLTPMGALVGLFGLLGAGIALAYDNTTNLGKALSNLEQKGFNELIRLLHTKDLNGDGFITMSDVVKQVTGDIKQWFGDALGYVTGTAIPAVVKAFEFVKGYVTRDVIPAVITAFRFVKDILFNDVIPAVEAFASWIGDHVGPALTEAGHLAGVAFDFIKQKAQQFWGFVQPYIEPAIHAFAMLGGAIAAAFSGDFSHLGSAALGALGGIGSSLGNIGTSIFDSLKPIAGKIWDWIKSIFTADHLSSALDAVSGFVEKVGYILGSIVSNPKFLAGVGILVGVAAKIGASFILGFAQGVIDNIPRLLKDAGVLIWKVILDPQLLAEIIGGALLITQFRNFFRNAGEEGASGFADGFKKRLSSAGGFLQGIVQGPSGLQASNFFAGADALEKKFDELSLKFRAFGGNPNTIFEPTAKGIADLTTHVNSLSKGFSDAQKSGLIARQTLTEAFTGGTAGMVQGIKAVGTALKNNLGAAALAGIGGFLGGQAEGSAGGSGLISILSAGVGGLAVGGPIAGAVGALSAAIGQAFGSSSHAAQQAKQAIQDYADAIKNDLGPQLDSGTKKLLTMADAFAGGSGGDVAKLLASKLSSQDLSDLQTLGITIGEIVKANNTGLDPNNIFDKIEAFGRAPGDTWGQLATDLNDAQAAIGPAIDRLNALNFALGSGNRDTEHAGVVLQDLANHAKNAADQIGHLHDGFSKTPVTTAIDVTTTKMGILNAQLDTYLANIAQAFGSGTSKNQAILNASDLATGLPNFDANTIAGQAGFQQAMQQIQQNAAQYIADGIKSGSITGAQQANTALLPLLQATTQTIAAIPISDAFTDQQKQDLLNKVAAAYQAVGTDPNVVGAANAAAQSLVQAYLGTVSTMPSQFLAIGKATAMGLHDGIIADTPAAVAASISLADQIVSATNDRLKRHSPSRVFYEIGQDVGQGLAMGISDSTQTIGDLLSSTIDSAIAQASSSATAGKADLAAAAAKIFGATTGSNAALGGGGTAGGVASGISSITSGLAGLLGSIASQVSTAADLAKIPDVSEVVKAGKVFDKKKKKWVVVPAHAVAGKTPEQAFEGQSSPTSLNPSDFFGATNVQALSGVLDSIAQLGQTLLSSGAPASQVVTTMEQYVAQLENQATALGFSKTGLDQLVDAFGLSNSALEDFISTINAVGTAAASPGGTNNPNPSFTPDPNSMNLLEQVLAANPGLPTGALVNLLSALGFDTSKLPIEQGMTSTQLLQLLMGGGTSSSSSSSAAASTPDTTAAALPPPVIVNVHPIYGDPIAIGVASANAVNSAVLAAMRN